MRPKLKLLILALVATCLTACSVLAPVPTATVTPEPTATATLTASPTKTPRPPTGTPTVPVLRMPVGVPAAEWEDIPVMPDALAGEEDGSSYSFTTRASSEAVQAFYLTALAPLGWSHLASGEGTTGAVFMIFTQGQQTASITIIPQPDGIVYVMIVK